MTPMSITPVACTLLRGRLRKGVCRKPCFCTALLRVGSLHSLQALDVEISLVSLVDNNRQWFKSAYGLGVEETARDLAFCGWTILPSPIGRTHVMVVEDALQVECSPATRLAARRRCRTSHVCYLQVCATRVGGVWLGWGWRGAWLSVGGHGLPCPQLRMALLPYPPHSRCPRLCLLCMMARSQDRRFAGSPLVEGNPNIRFYAGVQLVAPNNQRLGSLCAISSQPRVLQVRCRIVNTTYVTRCSPTDSARTV
jgi:GAF domain-containing protein